MPEKDELRYEIGKVCLSFNVKHPGIKRLIESSYKDYASHKKPDICIDIEHRDHLIKPDFESLIFKTPFWKIGRQNRNLFLYIPDKRGSYLMRFNKTLDKLKCYTQSVSGGFFLSDFSEILFSLILSPKKALILHACGILNGKKAYCFIAHSGGGKSTIAKLALKQGFRVLNDDRIVIRKEKGLFKIYGTPWHGEVEKTLNNSSFIKKVFFLKKAKVNKIRLMSKREALMEFLENNLCIPINKEIKKERLDICSDLAENLKCYWLYFRRDISIWRFLDELAK